MKQHVLSALVCYFAAAAANATIEYAFVNDRQEFTCRYGPYSNDGIVWQIATAKSKFIMDLTDTNISIVGEYTAQRNGTFSSLTFLMKSSHTSSSFSCKSNNRLLQFYEIKRVIDENIISNPQCDILPVFVGDTYDETRIEYRCTANMLQGITPTLDLQGQTSNADGIAVKVVTIDDFTEYHNISCELSVLGKENLRSCTFPEYVEMQLSCEQGAAVLNCDVDEDDEITWYFLNATYSKQAVDNSWFKSEGKDMLLRQISDLEMNQVIVCQKESTNNSITKIGLGKISCSQLSRPSTTTPPDIGHGNSTAYVYLTFIMVCLWLGTLGAIISYCGYKTRNNRLSTGYETSRLNELTSSNEGVARGVGALPTRQDINEVRVRESKNQNNSALHHDDESNDVYEGIAVGATNNKEGTDARDDRDRVYFCLERSPTSSTKSSVTSDHGKETAQHLDEHLLSVRSPTPKRDNSDIGCYEDVKGGITNSNEIPVNVKEVERCNNEELFPLYSTVHK